MNLFRRKKSLDDQILDKAQEIINLMEKKKVRADRNLYITVWIYNGNLGVDCLEQDIGTKIRKI